MKKIIIISLASLFLLSLTACKGGEIDVKPADGGVTTQTPASLITPAIRPTVNTQSGSFNGNDVETKLADALNSHHNLDSIIGNSQGRYHKVWDLTDGDDKYIGAYDSKDEIIIIDGGKEKQPPFVKIGYYIGKIKHGKIINIGYSSLDATKNTLLLAYSFFTYNTN